MVLKIYSCSGYCYSFWGKGIESLSLVKVSSYYFPSQHIFTPSESLRWKTEDILSFPWRVFEVQQFCDSRHSLRNVNSFLWFWRTDQEIFVIFLFSWSKLIAFNSSLSWMPAYKSQWQKPITPTSAILHCARIDAVASQNLLGSGKISNDPVIQKKKNQKSSGDEGFEYLRDLRNYWISFCCLFVATTKVNSVSWLLCVMNSQYLENCL